jgi:hypothetical protein
MLTRISFGAGAVAFTIVRQNKHLVVDFTKPDGGTVRSTVSVSASDARAERNAISELRNKMKGH